MKTRKLSRLKINILLSAQVLFLLMGCQLENAMKWKSVRVYQLRDCYPDNQQFSYCDTFYLSITIGFEDSLYEPACFQPSDAWLGGNIFIQTQNGKKLFIREIIDEYDKIANIHYVVDSTFIDKSEVTNFASYLSNQKLFEIKNGQTKEIIKSKVFKLKIPD